MDRNQIRQVITAQFYQSLAENRVQVQSIPQSELQAIVNALADGVFAALSAVEDEGVGPVASAPRSAGPPPAATEGEMPETLLWRGRPYLTIVSLYEVTTQRICISRGLLGHTVQEIELVRVKDSAVKQHMGERMLDIGDVTVISDDATTPEVTLHNVSNPVELREIIRKAVIEEKQRRGIRYRVELE
jgi:hypothetical protein